MFASCQDSFIDVSSISIKSINIELDYTKAKVYGKLQTESTSPQVSEIIVSYGLSEGEMTKTSTGSYDSINGYSVDLVGLQDGAKYFFRVDVLVGKACISSDINSFITFPLGPIDLDLPSGNKWASHNLGANKPTDAGLYFAWGETAEKTNYSWEAYIYCNDGNNSELTKYTTSKTYAYLDKVDNLVSLEQMDDAAHVLLGVNWVTPSYKDWIELIDNCIITKAEFNGLLGCMITSKKEPNNLKKWIFLPSQYGYYDMTSIRDDSSSSYYWSSTLSSLDRYALNFDIRSSGKVAESRGSRCFGELIRPVCK